MPALLFVREAVCRVVEGIAGRRQGGTRRRLDRARDLDADGTGLLRAQGDECGSRTRRCDLYRHPPAGRAARQRIEHRVMARQAGHQLIRVHEVLSLFQRAAQYQARGRAFPLAPAAERSRTRDRRQIHDSNRRQRQVRRAARGCGLSDRESRQERAGARQGR